MSNYNPDLETETTPDGRQRCQDWWGERDEFGHYTGRNVRCTNAATHEVPIEAPEGDIIGVDLGVR